jgi:hypothetical protein
MVFDFRTFTLIYFLLLVINNFACTRIQMSYLRRIQLTLKLVF